MFAQGWVCGQGGYGESEGYNVSTYRAGYAARVAVVYVRGWVCGQGNCEDTEGYKVQTCRARCSARVVVGKERATR